MKGMVLDNNNTLKQESMGNENYEIEVEEGEIEFILKHKSRIRMK